MTWLTPSEEEQLLGLATYLGVGPGVALRIAMIRGIEVMRRQITAEEKLKELEQQAMRPIQGSEVAV